MKNILMILLIGFASLSAFSQSTERSEKLGKVAERNSPPPRQNSNPPQQTVIVQPTPYYNPYYTPYRNPYSWNRRYSRRRGVVLPPPQPMIYQPRPQRERMDNGTDFGLMTTLGVYEGSRPTIGLRFLLGGEDYYGIFGWEASARNPYSHYNNISIIDVEGWEDESIGEFTTTNTLELGMGIHMRDGLYATVIGYGTTNREYFAFMDEEYVLSPNGQYSINGQTKTLTGLQMGIAHRSRRTIVSAELGLLGPKRLSMGIGLFL